MESSASRDAGVAILHQVLDGLPREPSDVAGISPTNHNGFQLHEVRREDPAFAGTHEPHHWPLGTGELVLGQLSAHVRDPGGKCWAMLAKVGIIDAGRRGRKRFASCLGDPHDRFSGLLDKAGSNEARACPSHPVLDSQSP